MDYTKSVGNIVELQCISKFIEMGFECSIPYGDACKYDFIADIQGELLRFQCKSAMNPQRADKSRDTEAFTISCVCSTTNTTKTVQHKYTDKDADYFATYFQGKVYVIPIDGTFKSKTLRFSPPKNGQEYTKAEDFLVENVFGHLQDPLFLEQVKQRSNKPTQFERVSYLCAQCGKNEVYQEGTICSACDAFNRRKVSRPSREELKSIIRTESFVSLGKKYGVSDNAVRKWCKNYGLPYKKKDLKTFSDEEWALI